MIFGSFWYFLRYFTIWLTVAESLAMILRGWLIDSIAFYAVSAIFQSCNGGILQGRTDYTCIHSASICIGVMVNFVLDKPMIGWGEVVWYCGTQSSLLPLTLLKHLSPPLGVLWRLYKGVMAKTQKNHLSIKQIPHNSQLNAIPICIPNSLFLVVEIGRNLEWKKKKLFKCIRYTSWKTLMCKTDIFSRSI